MQQADFLLKPLIAHRGLHDGRRIPENSLAAFAAAKAKGYAIELDVRLSVDGVVMVFHDENLERIAGRRERVDSLSAEALSSMSLYQSDQTIPTLATVLGLIAGAVPLFIELKGFGRAGDLEQALMADLDDYHGDYAVISFNPNRIAWFAKHHPEIIRGQSAERFLGYTDQLSWLRRWAYRLMLFNWRSKPHFVTYDVDLLPCWRARNLRRRGVPLVTWTINTAEKLEIARRYADNLIFEAINPDEM